MASKSRSVRRALAVANSFEVLYRASLCCLLPFIPIYLRHLGISADALGVISAVRSLLALGLAPLLSRCWAGSASGLRIGMVALLLVAVAANLSLTAIKPDGYGVGDDGALSPLAAAAAAGRLKDHRYGDNADTEGCATGWTLVVEPASDIHRSGWPFARPKANTNSSSSTTPQPNATAWTSNSTRWESSAALLPAVANDSSSSAVPPTAPASTANTTHPEQQQQRGVNVSDRGSVTLGTPRGVALLRDVFLQEPAFFYVLLAVSTAGVCLSTVQVASRSSLRSYIRKRAASAALDGGASAAVAALAPASWPRYSGALGRRAGYVAAAVAVFGVCAVVAHLDCVIALGMSRLTVHFYAFSLGSSLAMLPALFYPSSSSSPSSSSPSSSLPSTKVAHSEKTSQQLLDGAVARRERVRGVAYLVAAFVSGVGAVSVDNFLFWHLEDAGGTQLLLGSSVAAACLAKAVFFTSQCSHAADDEATPWPRCIRCAVCSPRVPPGVSAFLALACTAGQLGAFSFVSSAPWLVLPAQLLSVLGGPALRSSSMRHSERSQVGAGGAASTEGHLGPEGVAWVIGRDRLFALCHGLGCAAGGVASGVLVAGYGYEVLFRACAVGTATWAVIFAVVQLLCRKPRVRYSHLLARTSRDNDDDFAYSEDDSDSEEEEEGEEDGSTKKLLPGTDA
ncbi:unnamed protein product [Lampetra planeri]